MSHQVYDWGGPKDAKCVHDGSDTSELADSSSLALSTGWTICVDRRCTGYCYLWRMVQDVHIDDCIAMLSLVGEVSC